MRIRRNNNSKKGTDQTTNTLETEMTVNQSIDDIQAALESAEREKEEARNKQDIVKQTAEVCVEESYKSRSLHKCLFCGLHYNVGERIPRIIVGCGHTFCTSCLSYFIRRGSIRCPLCRKVLKHVESVDRLPLNFNMLYEIVVNDEVLRDINFDEATDENGQIDDEYLCKAHGDRVNHFYCSEHTTVFCRECIKEEHNEEKCFVVDLYEIEKMKQLQLSNMQLNQKQVKKVDKSWVVKQELVKTDKKRRLNTAQNRRDQQRGRNMQTRSEREVSKQQVIEQATNNRNANIPSNLNLDVEIQYQIESDLQKMKDPKNYGHKEGIVNGNQFGKEDGYQKSDLMVDTNNNSNKQLEFEQAKMLLKEAVQDKNSKALFEKLESNEDDVSYGSQGENESYYDEEEDRGAEDDSNESGELTADALKKAKEEFKRQLQAELSGTKKKQTQKNNQNQDESKNGEEKDSKDPVMGCNDFVPANLEEIEVLEYQASATPREI